MGTITKESSNETFKEIKIYLNSQMASSLHTHMEKVCNMFHVKFVENQSDSESLKQCAIFHVNGDNCLDAITATQELQKYIEEMSVVEAEDSSYDSECDNEEKLKSEKKITHKKVSRTTSDTLEQEFAEYVNNDEFVTLPKVSTKYNARVEFALKLGYTERLVQTALARLGPDPAQNELLAELIKLGAQQNSKVEYTTEVNNADGIQLPLSASKGFSQTTDPTNPNSITDEVNINYLRPIVVDGSNVAMSHGNKEIFSCLGIKLCVDWFKNRGHKDITVFVPKWRKENSRLDNPIKDQDILTELEKERMLVFTPSRLVGGKRMVCYDDRYILKLAVDNDGIVVSNDNYRDLVQESTEFKKVVEERVLMYSFVNDRFMPPDDPLGRAGPTLDNFLRMQPKKVDLPPACPYGKKCTYGNKCKFNHPERGLGPHKTVTERLSEHAARHLSARNVTDFPHLLVQGKSQSVPLSSTYTDCCESSNQKKLCRTRTAISDNISYSDNNCKFPAPQDMKYSAGHHNNFINFSKSRSTENISPNKSPKQPIVGDFSQSNMSVQNYNVLNPYKQQQNHVVSQELDDSVNIHSKLKRQLTLGPSECDTRFYQLGNRMAAKINHPAMGPNVSKSRSPSCQHRVLSPSLSGPPTQHLTQRNLHQCVTRIASAPDSRGPWPTGTTPASSSEPHINLWPNQQRFPITAAQDQRRRLHYHLSSIFPEDEVHTVMQLYPDETDAQRICAAILNMFPKM